MAAEFTHLHLHTDYSLLDGACDVDKLAKHLTTIGQTSAAITDHGNIYGAVHFFDAMKKKDLKPILGCELYIGISSALPARPRCTASTRSRASAKTFSPNTRRDSSASPAAWPARFRST
jgi:DNA polymerase III alpha subunit